MQRVSGLHSWIDAVPQIVRDAVRARMKQRSYEDGQAVYLMGDEGHELYQINSGKVRFCTYALNGREVQFAELRPGDCFGELSLIDGLHRTHCALAVGTTRLSVLHQGDFNDLYSQYPEIARALNRLLAHRLHIAYTFGEDAILLSLRDRLSRLLSRLAYTVGAGESQTAVTVHGITHEQLARMLGSTRQAVTRELKFLETSGLVKSSYGKIVVENVRELVASSDELVGSEPIVPDYSD